MFFFDGEKIVGIAREGTEDITIRESFKSLLGLEIVEQLRADLQVNLTRNLTDASKSLQQDFEKYKTEKDETMHNTERLREKLAQKQSEMDALRMEIDNMEARISKIGGEFASGRDAAKEKLAAKKITRDNILQRIMELCSGVLPFAVIPADLEILSEQIWIDESIQQQMMGQKLLDSKFKKITAKIRTQKFWNNTDLDAKDRDRIVYMMSDLLEEERMLSEPRNKPVFGFSTLQISRITGIIQQANTTALQRLKKDTEKIIDVEEAISQSGDLDCKCAKR